MHAHAELAAENRLLLRKLLVVCGGMLAFAFALVPIYRQVCEATGLSKEREVAPVNTQVDASRDVTVELLASTAGLPWRFETLTRSVKLHPGELTTVHYRVVNTLGRAVTAQAVMSTAPEEAARWIQKQTCFCFSNQTLAAGEARDMPVVFRVSPEAPRDLKLLTLSYSFMEVPNTAPRT